MFPDEKIVQYLVLSLLFQADVPYVPGSTIRP